MKLFLTYKIESDDTLIIAFWNNNLQMVAIVLL